MEVGHTAGRCKSCRQPKQPMATPVASRAAYLPDQLPAEVFLPAPPPPPRGNPSLAGCVARLEVGCHDADALRDVLPGKLADHFGGSSDDFKVSLFSASALAVFFPNWVARESAIGRSPLWLNGVSCTFSNWVEPGEVKRGHLLQKVWLRLVNWPLLCWSVEEVKAAVSRFGELWEVDEASLAHTDVSCFRVLVRCSSLAVVPSELTLWVEDRRFIVSVSVDSWEAAEPILLGEETDRRLGLTVREDQDAFAARMDSVLPGPSGGKGRLGSISRGLGKLASLSGEAPPRGSGRISGGFIAVPYQPQQSPLLSSGSSGDQVDPLAVGLPPLTLADGLELSAFPPLAPSPGVACSAQGDVGPSGHFTEQGSSGVACPFASSSALGG